MAAYDASQAKILRRLDTAGQPDDFELVRGRYGFGISWDPDPGRAEVDLDLQCVVVNKNGVITDCAYYNNLKAARAITHSGDESVGKPGGIQEMVWVHMKKIPADVAVLVFVVAAYSGGYLRDVRNGKFRVLEDSERREIANVDLEQSDAHVDIVAAMHVASDGWMLRIIEEPAQQGQHFMDILPLIGQVVRIFLPHAPARQKVAFAMEKGGVLDLPVDIHEVTVGLGWDTDAGKVDLDVSAVLLDRNSKFLEPVYYGRLQSEKHGIQHTGDNLTGEGEGDDEQIIVQLDRVGPEVFQIYFVVNIYTRGKSFRAVANPYCRVVDGSSSSEMCRYALKESAGTVNGLIISKFAREAGGRWGFHALGIPCTGHTWKDSLPAVYSACKIDTRTLRKQGSTDTLGMASPVVVRGAENIAPVVGQDGAKPCCTIS